MKKLVLTMVLAFATISISNATGNVKVETEPARCGELAQEYYDNAISQGASYQDAFDASETVYQTCKWLTRVAEYLN